MKLTVVSLAFLLLTNMYTPTQSAQQVTISQVENEKFTGDCAAKINEYDSVLLWNNVRYKKNSEFNPDRLEKGQKVGEVSFKVNGNVCFGYRLKNGDATWSEKGTPIYKVKGYSQNFRLFVGTDLYEVSENPHAKKVGDIFDIAGKVKKITLEYPIENSPLVEFSEDAKCEFIEDFLLADYVPFEKIYKDSMFLSTKYFLRIHLNDDSKIVISYWPDENAFNQGYGTEKIKKIILNHADKLKAIAPPPQD